MDQKNVVRKSKQVIVMRTDLRNTEGHKIRTGKLIAQGAHASMKALLDRMNPHPNEDSTNSFTLHVDNGSALEDWLFGKFTKVCVAVSSEEELVAIYTKAKEQGLICSLIVDAGLTEFNNEPTITCCAIGPNWSDEIDPLTQHLKLL